MSAQERERAVGDSSGMREASLKDPPLCLLLLFPLFVSSLSLSILSLVSLSIISLSIYLSIS